MSQKPQFILCRYCAKHDFQHIQNWCFVLYSDDICCPKTSWNDIENVKIIMIVQSITHYDSIVHLKTNSDISMMFDIEKYGQMIHI